MRVEARAGVVEERVVGLGERDELVLEPGRRHLGLARERADAASAPADLLHGVRDDVLRRARMHVNCT
jgi:hypothetical protein